MPRETVLAVVVLLGVVAVGAFLGLESEPLSPADQKAVKSLPVSTAMTLRNPSELAEAWLRRAIPMAEAVNQVSPADQMAGIERIMELFGENADLAVNPADLPGSPDLAALQELIEDLPGAQEPFRPIPNDPFMQLDDLISRNPERSFEVILKILESDAKAEAIHVLAAGPLETLLDQHGPRMIDRIEAEARSSPAFAHLLGGVWGSSMAPSVWERVIAARSGEW